MGFLFDSLVHLLASEPAAKRAATARMLGRVLKTEAVALAGPETGAAYDVWHYRKVIARPFAVTVTVGLATPEEPSPRELLALTLADARADANGARANPIAALLCAVVARGAEPGAVVALPEGLLGRSSHTHAVVAPIEGHLREHREYQRIVGGRLDLVVPVTAREAVWIGDHGAEAYVDAMTSQKLTPYADRAPGEAHLAP